MARNRELARIQRNALTAEEAEKLFSTVDETGHTNEETALKQRKHRRLSGHGVDIDPLSDADPSGSNVESVITKTAVAFVVCFLVIVVALQVSTGLIRRANTANLSNGVSLSSVASALKGGVEWGNGFTQFPESYSVQEADENTHRIEVTVTDTTSEDALQAFAGSQIQASAFAVNSLLNQNINTVIYHVNVYVNEKGEFQTSKLFGFIKPSGELKSLMTFIWTKTTTENGVRFNCTITGVDSSMQSQLRENITSSFTPATILSNVLGDKSGDKSDDKSLSENKEDEKNSEGEKDNSSSESAPAQDGTVSQTVEGAAE